MKFIISILTALVLTIMGLLLNWLEPDFHQPIYRSEKVKVIDGDTIILGKRKIRLQGIDAPEMKQTCQRIEGNTIKYIQCGILAAEALAKFINNKNVKCTNEGKDKYKRTLSYCFVEGSNINRLMVRQEYALAYTRYDNSFMVDELIARLYKRGLWQTIFEEPWQWRKHK